MGGRMDKTGHGLILGKFLPPHAGHQFLVRFAQNFVERLTVLVCSIEREPIPGKLRCEWMQELFPQARLVHVTDELPQDPSEHPRFWDLWRETVLRAADEPIDFIFASEDYGYRLAAEVGATFIPVDIARQLVPISGTAIRNQPLANWEYIPECVRPHFVKRICLFGPESTGKSTLARDLAAHFNTVHAAEFARGLLDHKDGVCEPEDIPLIARGQAAAEDALARRANKVIFCDTDLLLTTIWSDVLFGACPAWVRQAAERRHYDLCLLLDVDVPWVDDQQRNLPHRRSEFFERCRDALQSRRRPYVIIRGAWPERFAQACRAVQQLLDASSS
ncbi:MAG: AAA family ATPase [Planctomycetes bacterium]|nr:AAA family ATPase [Planctomycetota bacterium]